MWFRVMVLAELISFARVVDCDGMTPLVQSERLGQMEQGFLSGLMDAVRPVHFMVVVGDIIVAS